MNQIVNLESFNIQFYESSAVYKRDKQIDEKRTCDTQLNECC